MVRNWLKQVRLIEGNESDHWNLRLILIAVEYVWIIMIARSYRLNINDETTRDLLKCKCKVISVNVRLIMNS